MTHEDRNGTHTAQHLTLHFMKDEPEGCVSQWTGKSNAVPCCTSTIDSQMTPYLFPMEQSHLSSKGQAQS